MRYALRQGDRVEAEPAQLADCPICHGAVRSKCGHIVVWHWSHLARDCDDWSEPESIWHRQWQERVEPNRREVVIGHHRADIVTPSGTVTELQHSPIGVDEIRCREAHYQRMVWLFDATDAYAVDRINIRSRGDYVTFRWKHPRKSIASCSKPVYLDLGNDQLLRVKRLHTKAPCGGWGVLGDDGQFAAWLNGVAP